MKRLSVTYTCKYCQTNGCFFLFIFLLSSCQINLDIESIHSEVGEWTIGRGDHHFKKKGQSLIDIQLIRSDIIEGYAIFDSSCWYEPVYGWGVDDVNKLIGFSPAKFSNVITGDGRPQHVNSDRIGWMADPIKGKIQLGTYAYRSQIRDEFMQYMVTVDCNKLFYYRIEDNHKTTTYTIVYQDSTHVTSIFSHKENSVFMLKPYYGGDAVAPHPMKITFKRR